DKCLVRRTDRSVMKEDRYVVALVQRPQSSGFDQSINVHRNECVPQPAMQNEIVDPGSQSRCVQIYAVSNLVTPITRQKVRCSGEALAFFCFNAPTLVVRFDTVPTRQRQEALCFAT